VCRFRRLLVGFLLGSIGGKAGAGLAFLAQLVEFLFGQVLYAYVDVLRSAGADQLVQLRLDRRSENPKKGPLNAHRTTIATLTKKVSGRPVA
jgi:hypothetical protein